ncbi:MAG: amidohydrolase [Acidobacteriota bacterium]
MFASILLMADLILINGNIYTVDTNRPRAQAVAVRNGRFVNVGTNQSALALKDPGTKVIDLEGKTVVPGLVDAHGHVSNLGFALARLDLVGTTSPSQIARKVRAKVHGLPHGEWLLGRGWDQNDWQKKVFPRASDLDAASPDNPVVLTRVDGHAIWANSRAMRLAGVTAETPDPPGGRIIRDASGTPTGVFVDAASGLIESKIPAPTREQTHAAIERGLRRCLRSGLTGVHDAGVSAVSLGIYEDLLVKRDFPFRVYAMLSNDAGLLESRFAMGPSVRGADRRLTVRAVKLYIDGALGSRGAALLRPYEDDPGNSGLLRMEPEALRTLILRAARAGFQPCVHAIGDRGNRIVLDAMQAALETLGPGDRRMRLEHAQVLAPEDLGRLARLNVIASMQPTHATSDMPWAEDRLGPERIKGAYAWRDILSSGARMACGSDFPVESERPLLGFYATVTRQEVTGRPPGGWFPDQRLTRTEALKCFTLDAAYAAFDEDRIGSITTGKLADMTILSRDIMTIPVHEILDTEPVMTIVGGRIAYEKK